jgi:hypothetical protein
VDGAQANPMTDSNATTQANVGGVHVRGRLALLTLAALACLGIATSVLSNIGMCFSEGKILSDKDYFKGAVNVVIHDPVDGVVEDAPGAIVFKQVHSQKYSDAKEFLSENPNCCKFVPANSGDGGPEISILDMLRRTRTVEVSYDKRYFDENNVRQSSKVNGKVAVSSCGGGRPFR